MKNIEDRSGRRRGYSEGAMNRFPVFSRYPVLRILSLPVCRRKPIAFYRIIPDLNIHMIMCFFSCFFPSVFRFVGLHRRFSVVVIAMYTLVFYFLSVGHERFTALVHPMLIFSPFFKFDQLMCPWLYYHLRTVRVQ
ncbi:hypothetical protein QBC32DRAFT_83078 [Pseudoneurospora amorphoporcata]|uniref:Transmembrane protein n=1 Tax=Pseudoneurospora amorphoporcata TaxID=241081 RepID=A0AAN6NKI2_9PEZI|nr:hypothetical protein QBC32DRAFT_83078 [Pseudoneurospora amorphoporcata]